MHTSTGDMNDKFAYTCAGQTPQPPLPPVSPQPPLPQVSPQLDPSKVGIIAGSFVGVVVLALVLCTGFLICIRKRGNNPYVLSPASDLKDPFGSRKSKGAFAHPEAAFKPVIFATTIIHF